jgi:hypothetical protein
MTLLHCPACNAPLTLSNRFSQSLVCPYCCQTSHRTEGGLIRVGNPAKLTDIPSPLSRGMQLRIDEKHQGIITGQLRCHYEGGAWNDWYIPDLAESGWWIHEDEGELTLFKETSLTEQFPPLETIAAGESVPFGKSSILVTEVGEGVIAGGAGELPFPLYPGEGFYYLDGLLNGSIISIEETLTEVTMYTGTPYTLLQF